MSLGASRSNLVDDAVNSASGLGIIVVVAAGNDNFGAGCSSPCRADDAICVGALTWNSIEQNVTAAEYSNYGVHVDIWAPGTEVASARSSFSPGSGLSVALSGTSMACPHISGVVAQLLSSLHEAENQTAADIKDLMQTDCQVMYGDGE